MQILIRPESDIIVKQFYLSRLLTRVWDFESNPTNNFLLKLYSVDYSKDGILSRQHGDDGIIQRTGPHNWPTIPRYDWTLRGWTPVA